MPISADLGSRGTNYSFTKCEAPEPEAGAEQGAAQEQAAVQYPVTQASDPPHF